MNRFSVKALATACHAVIWFIVVLTVAAERFPPVKAFLAGLTGHHWTAKGLIALIVFFVVAFLFSRKEDAADPLGSVSTVIISAVLGALAIFVFYLLHTMGLA
jgi:hypothetical protein